MKISGLFTLWIAALSMSQVVAQTRLTNDTLTQFTIYPSTTDSTITLLDTPHRVAYNPSSRQGKLLLWMPGTNGIAEKSVPDLLATAIEQGYRVISLQYNTSVAIAQVCKGEALDDNANCAEDVRMKRVYGENTTDLITDEPQDAILNRFVKLLLFLTKYDKEGNWEAYLENNEPKWDQIAVAGQSQGGGMACFIAKRERVARVISFSGGWDYSAENTIAGWYAKESETAVDRWYATYNVAEPAASVIIETCQAMAIPADHVYALDLDVREGKKAHSDGVGNAAYKSIWKELLGSGN